MNHLQSSEESPRDWSNWLVGDIRLLVLIVGLVVVAGLSSLMVLPRMEDPILAKRVAIIVTRMPGADAARVESLITEKIELRLRQVEQIKEMRSQSRPGISSITIELLDSVVDSDEVWSNVRGKIEDALPELPAQASRPEFDDLEVRAFASIVSVAWDRDEPVDFGVLRRTARELQDRLQTVPGTETVDRFGDPGEEVLVKIDPQKAAAIGLSANDVATQLSSFDAKDAAGLVRSEKQDLVLEVGTQFDEASDVARADIRAANGRFVRLGQIADVSVTTPQPLPRSGRHQLVGGESLPAITLGVLIRPETRIDQWAHDAQTTIDDFTEALPAGLKIVSVLDQSQYVSARLENLTLNLGAGAAAVCLVILLLMGWRSAIIVSSALPLTMLTVLFLMRMLGIPIHQMSITGLIIALGLLIDNAIVIVDEVSLERRHGHSILGAVSISVKRLTVPLLGSTLTTAFAFAPIAIMPGPAGEFVGSIAISVMLAIFTSLFFALTVVAALAGLLVKVPDITQKSRLRDTLLYGIHWPNLTANYRRFILTTLKFPRTALAMSVVVPILGFVSATQLPEQFFPPGDRDQFHIEVELPAGASINDTINASLAVDQVLAEEKIAQVDWFFGESAPTFYYNVVANRQGTPNFGQAIVKIESADDTDAMIPRLQMALDQRVVGARVLVRQLEQGPPFDAPLEIRLFGPDLDVLSELGDSVREILAGIPEVSHTRSLLAETLPKIKIEVDEQAARMAGLSPRDVALQVQVAMDGRVSGSVIQDVEELPVRVRTDDQSRSELAGVRSMDLVAIVDGKPNMVPLRAIASTKLEPEVGTIVRLNQRRMNEISGYLDAGVLPSKALDEFNRRLEASSFDLPSGYELKYGGEDSKRNDAVGNLLASVGLLAGLMVTTLVLSFGSFRMATIIGGVGFLSIGLGLGSLWLGGYPFGFMAIIGTMGLIGVAINDSIVVLASLDEHHGAGALDISSDNASNRIEGVADTIVNCTRHVVATTLTTVAGFAPLIFSGGKFWPPLAVAIAGGVVGATMLAIVFVPSAFVVLKSICVPCPTFAAVPESTREAIPANAWMAG
jgi:multidrug efflux pump subunit AcrB